VWHELEGTDGELTWKREGMSYFKRLHDECLCTQPVGNRASALPLPSWPTRRDDAARPPSDFPPCCGAWANWAGFIYRSDSRPVRLAGKFIHFMSTPRCWLTMPVNG